ncbi:hypothetical protein UCDDA912_g00719 [Diaporthe ampelina]|uniref:Uncharacterized protein n=1 Tax=Diaporthe ampelina TaxID=1214573 RepID=A0A0G2FYT5_9PEZI|nr:hypothetical protein UCDDA912_g00719 [Diaporthe ampelina]
MPGASNNNGPPNFGLTPRELELTVKAMKTLVENGVKPDFEKLAKTAKFKDANAACKNWYFAARKLKASGSEVDGNASDNNKAGGKERGKRDADDEPEERPAKRGRVRKTDLPPAEDDKAEKKESLAEAEADEA